MLVILASRHDVDAKNLVERETYGNLCLLTCDDLSLRGWRYYPRDFLSSTAVLERKIVETHKITGVITRLSYVTEQELVRISPKERSYVAAEMMAFLTSLLYSLKCPVLNRPTPTCLSGPNWRQEKWIHVAAKLGIQVQDMTRHVPVQNDMQTTSKELIVTVVGGQCISDVDVNLSRQSVLLAETAGVDVLSVKFDHSATGYKFVGVIPFVNILDNKIMNSILRHVKKMNDNGHII